MVSLLEGAYVIEIDGSRGEGGGQSLRTLDVDAAVTPVDDGTVCVAVERTQ